MLMGMLSIFRLSVSTDDISRCDIDPKGEDDNDEIRMGNARNGRKKERAAYNVGYGRCIRRLEATAGGELEMSASSRVWRSR